MKLLANENFPLMSVKLLRQFGYDIKAIGENDPSIEDKQVIDLAIKENRLILTFDKDYSMDQILYEIKKSRSKQKDT